MGEKKIVKNTVSGKKALNGSQNRSHQRKDNKPKFLFLRPGDTLPPHLSVLASADRTVSASSTIMSEAKELLRIRVQNLGGNAALEFSLERGGTVHDCGYTYAAEFKATGKPALLAQECEKTNFLLDRVPSFTETLLQNNLLDKPQKKGETPKASPLMQLCIGLGIILLILIPLYFTKILPR